MLDAGTVGLSDRAGFCGNSGRKWIRWLSAHGTSMAPSSAARRSLPLAYRKACTEDQAMEAREIKTGGHQDERSSALLEALGGCDCKHAVSENVV